VEQKLRAPPSDLLTRERRALETVVEDRGGEHPSYVTTAVTSVLVDEDRVLLDMLNHPPRASPIDETLNREDAKRLIHALKSSAR
jgi:hypothetical protein